MLVYIDAIKHQRDIHSFPELLYTAQLCQLAVEQKAEVDSMLEVFQNKQKELESDEHLILKGEKRKAVLKGEIPTPKTASEEENSEIYFEDDTDVEHISSDSEDIPREVRMYVDIA